MTPTPEQSDAVDKFQRGGALKINAFAGTGKTTTLRLLAGSTERRGMYLAFNKAIAADAKAGFPANTSCSTVHSIAFRATPRSFQHGDKMTGSINANAVAKHLEYVDMYVEGMRLTSRSLGHLTLETLRKFMQGGKNRVEAVHVPMLGKLETFSEAGRARLRDAAVGDANRLWRRMCEPRDPIPLGHDGYLKLWAMSRPSLPADFILLDEAQDTNPVILEMLRHQRAQVVYVGDRHQQIYEWRGAVNAMERIATPHETFLTTSFRFGDRIADAASSVIAHLGETRTLTGNPAVTSFLGSDKADAIIARTNASVMSAVLGEMQAGRRPHVVGGTSDVVRMLRGVEDLKRSEPSDVAEFFGFANWGEIVEHVKTPEGQDLRTFVKLVTDHGEKQLIRKLNETPQDEREADVVVSTAHKAKGREWDTVSLVDDFLPPQSVPDHPEPAEQNPDVPAGPDGVAPPMFDPAEMRLFYVALTRAKIAVDVSPVALAHFGVLPGPRYEAPKPVVVRTPRPSAAVRHDAVGRGSGSPVPKPNAVAEPKGGILSSVGRWLWIPIAAGVVKLLFG